MATKVSGILFSHLLLMLFPSDKMLVDVQRTGNSHVEINVTGSTTENLMTSKDHPEQDVNLEPPPFTPPPPNSGTNNADKSPVVTENKTVAKDVDLTSQHDYRNASINVVTVTDNIQNVSISFRSAPVSTSNLPEDINIITENITLTTPSSDRSSLIPVQVGDNGDLFTMLQPLSPYNLHVWDRTSVSMSDYRMSMCKRRCFDGQVAFTLNPKCSEVKCYPCTCDRPLCEYYGTCCPVISMINPPEPVLGPYNEIQLIFPPGSLVSTGKNQTVKDTTYGSVRASATGCDTDSPSGFGFLYIRSCPDNYPRNEISLQCEQDDPGTEPSLDLYTRVTDVETNVTYYNIYCAQCNGVAETLSWQLSVACIHYMHAHTVTTFLELVTKSFKEKLLCTLPQDPPASIEMEKCLGEWFTEGESFMGDIIDRCNVTGRWPVYDDVLVNGCTQAQFGDLEDRIIFRSYISASYSHHGAYKNVFCLLCNMEGFPKYDNCDLVGSQDRPDFDPIVPPFTMLFGVKRSHTPSLSHAAACNDTDWPSPSGECIPLSCYNGKLLNNGSCVTAVDQIRGLGYNLRLWLLPRLDKATNTSIVFPMNPMIPMDYVLRRFYEQIETRVRPLLYEFNISYGALTMSENKGKDSEAKVTTDPANVGGNKQDFFNTDLPYLFWIDGNIVANKGMQRDSFEKQIMEKFLENDMEIRLSETGTLRLQPMVVLEDMDLIKHCTFAMTNASNVHCYTDNRVQLGFDMKHTLMYATIVFLRMSSILICPYVSFEPQEYTVKQELVDLMPRTTVILQLDGTKVYINEPEDLLMVDVDSNGDLNVCQDLLDTKLPPKSGLKKKTLDEVTFAEYVLTLICVGVSMVCLLLTLITYSRFEALRTLAGINNMCLCASLLLAQASMIASSLVQGPQALCTALGITTHYLWLCMFMCSFNCCFHMFRVFTAKTRSSHTTARLQNVRLAKNIMASVTLPGVVVGCVMVASYVTSKGKEIGYGADACYLNSEILVGASMIGPLLLTIICNLIFFLVVVYKIQQVRKLQNDSFNKDDRQNLYVYIKLSTMTGAFWIIQVFAEVADLHVFRFIAIVLNGLQGVFIFVSYTCNKRVAQLYHCSCPRREGVRSEGTRESRIELTSSKAEGNTEDTKDGEK